MVIEIVSNNEIQSFFPNHFIFLKGKQIKLCTLLKEL